MAQKQIFVCRIFFCVSYFCSHQIQEAPQPPTNRIKEYFKLGSFYQNMLWIPQIRFRGSQWEVLIEREEALSQGGRFLWIKHLSIHAYAEESVEQAQTKTIWNGCQKGKLQKEKKPRRENRASSESLTSPISKGLPAQPPGDARAFAQPREE